MLENWKVKRLISEQEISLGEQVLYDECCRISQGLIQRGQNDIQITEVTIDIHFEEIQKIIIEQIDLAKFTIWIAVAWFTDPVLFKKLVDKKNQGVNVQFIIDKILIAVIAPATHNRHRVRYESILARCFAPT
jgi:phosphatidylserine/phosphatidylglycerophosphate/cardiolipin synthase-like enzyme